MNKMHQKFVVPKKKHFNPPIFTPDLDDNKINTENSQTEDDEIPIKSIKSIDFNSSQKSAIPGIKYVDDEITIESIDFNSSEKSAIIDDIKKILEKYKEFISTNSVEIIRQELEDYKKITNQRIEKLVNLFLSIK